MTGNKLNTKKEVNKLRYNLQRILHFSGNSKNVDFYISALTEYNPYNTTEEITEWLNSLNKEGHFKVKQIPLTKLRKWSYDHSTGDLQHESGGFFSIRGLKVKTNAGLVTEWSQPIIHQPEIGILGIVTKKRDGILYLLMQAKPEPGNINTYQLSPTVQATRSNYMQLHGGKATPYLEYFIDNKGTKVLIDQLQSEQGARFFRKRNRNIIVQLQNTQKITLMPNFRWLTLGQLQGLVQKNNVVNMDTRSIISGISFNPENVTKFDQVNPLALRDCLEKSAIVGKPVSNFGIDLMISSHTNSKTLYTMDELLQKITREKFKCIIETKLIPLNKVDRWKRTNKSIYHVNRKYFSVIGVNIKTSKREVSGWDQPIIQQKTEGIIGFIIKKIKGTIHFLVQLKAESGVMDLLEISPTVQVVTDNYQPGDVLPYIENFIDRNNTTTIHDSYQSEEGGRFYQESNRNIILKVSRNFPNEESSLFMWASLKQLKELIKFNNFINIEARSLLSCLQMK